MQRLGAVLQSVDLDTLHEDASIGIQDALGTLRTGLAADDPVKAQLPDAASEPSDDVLTDQWDAADRRQRTAHLGPLLSLLPPALIDLVALADRYVETAEAIDPHDFDRDTDAEYDALVAAVRRLRQEPMRPVETTWRRGDGARLSADPSYVYDEGGRIVASANALHPDFEANVRRIVGAGAPVSVNEDLLNAAGYAEHWMALLHEDIHDEGSPFEQTVDALGERLVGPVHLESLDNALAMLRSAIANAGEVSRG